MKPAVALGGTAGHSHARCDGTCRRSNFRHAQAAGPAGVDQQSQALHRSFDSRPHGFRRPTATRELVRVIGVLRVESPSATLRVPAQSEVRAAKDVAQELDRPVPAHPMRRAP